MDLSVPRLDGRAADAQRVRQKNGLNDLSMSQPSPQSLLTGLRQTLSKEGLDYELIIRGFGQVEASDKREQGHRFSLREHVRGLLLSQLSNERPWGPIAANLGQIQELFLDFDPVALEAADPAALLNGLRALRCGNRSSGGQIASLADNIRTFRLIETDYGSVDAFITADAADRVARRLAEAGRYKLRYIGYTLALEYLRNVGIRAAKPDVHVRRVISKDRLAYTAGYPSEEEAHRVVADLAHSAGCNPTYLDNLIWMFCAQDYGNVCGAKPRCSVCAFEAACNYPQERLSA